MRISSASMLANYRRRMFRKRGSRAQRTTQKPNGARATLRGIRKGVGSTASSRYSRFDAFVQAKFLQKMPLRSKRNIQPTITSRAPLRTS